MPGSTLADIQDKVRRLTRSPSASQLADADLNNYINTFVIFDFPEQLRLINIRKTLTFFTAPNIDTYQSGDGFLPADFDNQDITIHPPVFIDGYESFYTQSREQFFAAYPMINTIQQVGTGDGATMAFNGTLNAIPVLVNEVLFSSIGANNTRIVLSDDGAGNLVGDGVGTINYVTGVFTLNFNVAPAAAQKINAHTVPYVAQRPNAMLFYQNQITVRPVPDQPYRVNFEVYVLPTELLATNQSPDLKQWWQYIAYGAAKKIFEDRQDLDSVALIMPEFKQQERLVLRRTLVQQSNDRSATIYSETNQGAGWGWFGWNS
jgi:hypothetical protein